MQAVFTVKEGTVISSIAEMTIIARYAKRPVLIFENIFISIQCAFSSGTVPELPDNSVPLYVKFVNHKIDTILLHYEL